MSGYIVLNLCEKMSLKLRLGSHKWIYIIHSIGIVSKNLEIYFVEMNCYPVTEMIQAEVE